MTVIPFKKTAGKKDPMPPLFKPEINKKVAFEDLMEKVLELANICGGWDEKAERFKPDVSDKITEIERAAREALELPTSD